MLLRSLIFSVIILSPLFSSEDFGQSLKTKDSSHKTALISSKGKNKKISRSILQAKKDQTIGAILKNALEGMHYKKMSIDNDLSQKAFDQLIKRLDYSKQFLLEKEVKNLKKRHGNAMDDQLRTGKHTVIIDAWKIITKRIKLIDQYRVRVFKGKFDFKKEESVETDPEKMSFTKNEKELLERWRKTFKRSVLNRYTSYLSEQEDEVDHKNKKKSDHGKKKESLAGLTSNDLMKKSIEGVNKKYKNLFARILKDDHEDQLGKFFNSIASVFGPHTVYLSPRRQEDFDIHISGSLEGIGAVLQEDGPFIKVVKVVPGGGAWRGKELEVDDIILAVQEGKKGEVVDIENMRVDDAVRYIRGKKGTIVRLTLKKSSGERKIISITRDVVKVEESFTKGSFLVDDKLGIKVGYIFVPQFYRTKDGSSAKDVKREVLRMKSLGAQSIILDLRDNGGGILEDAREMAGLFVPKGPIVQIRGSQGDIEILEDKDNDLIWDGPLFVMTNALSASASEIVAGAMQDYKRAVIIGHEFTHGKGSVQMVMGLNQGILAKLFGNNLGALKITVQKFYRITGESTQFRGVTPDIIFPNPYASLKNREKDLDYALPWDKVDSLNFTKWNKKPLKTSKVLSDLSVKRMAKDKFFIKRKEAIAYFAKKSDVTVRSLKLSTAIDNYKEERRMSNAIKEDYNNKDLKISHFEESLKGLNPIKKEEEKQWKEDFEQRKSEWVEGLRKDVELKEALNIIRDYLS